MSTLVLVTLVALFFVHVSSRAVPSPAQLEWGGRIGSIIHYNMATFAHTQGCSRSNWAGASNAKTFGAGLNGVTDTDSWGRAMAAANMSYAVYVAKHNCGFTTWPTQVKLPDGMPYSYSIQYSSCPECNVVRDFLATCKKYGIRPGFYYSIATNTFLNVDKRSVQPNPLPGMATVNQTQFYDIALAQLEELWSFAENELFEIWFDGGLPTDAYFRTGITKLLQRLQPNAATFNSWPIVNQTAIRWIGTENGYAPDPTWSSGSCGRGNAVCADCEGGNGGDPDSDDWCAAEVDSTLQLHDTWFYVEHLALHSLSDLQNSFHESLGRNANWLLDIAPPPNSSVAGTHLSRYSEFGDWLRNCYTTPVVEFSFLPGETTHSVALPMGSSFDRVRLIEDVSAGQIVRAYSVEMTTGALHVSNGTSIGAGKIDLLTSPVVAASAGGVRVTTDAPPTGLTVQLFSC